MATKKKPKNIFIMPCGASQTNAHLKDTILTSVKQSVIVPQVSEATQQELKRLFGEKDIAVWGSMDGRNNRIFFEKMNTGDSILFTVGKQVRVVGHIAVKTVSPELSKVLWPSDGDRTFSLIYFIDKIGHVDSPVSRVYFALGYKENYIMQGLTSVSEDRLKAFYAKYKRLDALLARGKHDAS
jgi:hypothetical protein